MSKKKIFNKCNVLIFIILFSSPGFLSAQNTYFFKHITEHPELTYQVISDIHYCAKGFLWFATGNRLYRYDGNSFNEFELQGDTPNAINSFIINDMYSDSKGNLWIATMNMLKRFDYQYERIIDYQLNTEEKKTAHTKQIQYIAEDRDSSLLVGTNNGFFVVDYEKHCAKLYKYAENNPNWHNRITFIMPAGAAKYWLGMPTDFGLFDTIDKQFTSYLDTINYENNAENGYFECFYRDKSERIWIGTIDNGVYIYDTRHRDVSHLFHQPDNKNSLSCNTVWSIIQQNEKIFWIGTELKGLNRFDILRNEFMNFKPESNSATSLSNKSITTLCVDSSQNLWVGTWSGINQCNLKQEQFTFIWLDDKEKIARDVKAICLDKYRYYWVATDDGLFRLKPDKKVIRHYNYNKADKKGLINYNVSAVAQDKNDFLWIGTFMGLQQFNPENGKFTSFKNDRNDTTQLLNDFINTIFIDSRNTVWVGTNAGLHRFNADKQNFTRFLASEIKTKGTYNIKGWNVLCIREDNRKRLWISTEAGLNIYDLNTSCFVPVPAKIRTTIDSLAVYDIVIDSENNYWFATHRGLFQFNETIPQIIRYTTDNGLISNRIHSLLLDLTGNIWIGTTVGLCCLNKTTGNFRCFGKADGLENTYFNQAACYRNSNELLFGTKTGIVSFAPQKVSHNQFVPPVYINGFRVFNKPIAIGDTVMGEVPLRRSIMFADTLYLNYKHSVISFDFIALNYQNSLKNVYAYKLIGFDNEWINTDAKRRTATYTNLSPGEYCFQVRASNNDLVWNKTGDKIYIIITPPPWKTWWAYTLYIAVFLGVLLLTMRILIIRENLKNSITIERIEAQKTKEIEQTKTRFFTNVSHEFRTPLTLIISPLENLMDMEEPDKQKKNYYRIIHKNADRLLKLVNQILDFSKLESGHLKLRVEKKDMVAFVSEIFNSFDFLMQKQNTEAHFYCSHKEAVVYFDADKLEKILYNLISNAIKYSDKNALVKLQLDLQSTNNPNGIETAHFRITNSGSGIPSDHLNKIFDRYYQIENNNFTKNGTGLGLAITYGLVKLHRGEISVKTNSENHTCFHFTIPVTSNSYHNEEIALKKAIPSTEGFVDTNRKPHKTYITENKTIEKSDKIKKPNRLLIVEDNTELRRYLVQQLQTTFDVYQAGNGKQGLEKATRELPDVIITDIMMPEMDGYELCRILKQQKSTCHIPVIMLTAKSSVKSEINGLETGADDYIVKPFNIKIIKLKLENIIQSRNAIKALFTKKTNISPSEITVNSIDLQIIEKAMQIVEKNIGNTEFSVKDFAKEMAMSKTLLYNKLKAITGMSATEFIRTIRLKRAAQLLASGQLTVNDVSNMVGFNSRNYFTNCFTDFYHCPPSEYKAKHTVNQ